MSFSTLSFLTGSLLLSRATAFTSSQYQLTHEYSGTNFFDGWDFYSGRDPTGGFVTYYSRSSSYQEGLIKTSEDGPAYMGVNSVDMLPFNNATGRGDGAGRPSVRIASKQAFTHGLFIGDFEHIPAGICGTWPAFWTLGPNWPFTGEIDILEGVNQNANNVMSLHTNETCIITGNASVMTGQLENTNCAYYPDYNVGCGVSDPSETSFGLGFNEAGGGVYAMQWTSESILIWHWPRSQVPADVDSKSPDPGNWGLPVAQLAVGNCTVDQHFQSHKIIFDTTFCGEYAGNPYVWSTDDDKSCKASTGAATCDQYVANNPEAFKNAYWSVNYVRVYQLEDPAGTETVTSYIASEQAPMAVTTSQAPVPTPNLDDPSLCPKYNFSVISDGKYKYEIACDFDPPGPDYVGTPYAGFKVNSLADCIRGCTYLNENNGTNTCGGVSHNADINFCYFKKFIDGTPVYRKGFNEVRLIYYGYPQITDDPRATADSTLTSVFVESIPTPQTYRPTTTVTFATNTTSLSSTISLEVTLGPGMGNNVTSSSTLPSDYSDVVTQSNASYITYTRSTTIPPNSASPDSSSITTTSITLTLSSVTTTTQSTITAATSTDPSVTSADFYIVFNVDVALRKSKRAIRYLAFDDQSQSKLVASKADATKFHLAEDGSLMTGDQYVAVDGSSSFILLRLSNTKPDYPVTIDVDGNGDVSVPGVDEYCLTSSGNLAVVLDGGATPVDCKTVEPELISAEPETSTSSTSDTTSNTTTSTTSKSDASDLPGSTTSRTSVTSGPSATPPKINDFVYAGCFGIPSKLNPAELPSLSIPLTSDSMTNAKCTAACKKINAYYAATHEQQCLCSTSSDLYSRLLNYPDVNCNIPCPGGNRDFCGGNLDSDSGISTVAKMKRQNRQITLVSLYNNTLLDSGTGQSQIPTTSSVSTTSNTSNTNDGTFPTGSVSYIVTGTDTATVISTTYVDVCNVCPGGLTTKATTITIPHCGCTSSYDSHLQTTVSVPSPAVPMVTVTKACNVCGHGGVQSTITITVPHTSSISQLATAVAAQAPISTVPVASQAPAASVVSSQNAAPASNGAMPIPSIAGTPNNVLAAPAPVSPDDSVDIMTTPTGPSNADTAAAPAGIQNPANLAAAPASPPSIPANSAMNGNMSVSMYGGSGNSSIPHTPVQSFTSEALRIGGAVTGTWWNVQRFTYSLAVGLIALGVVGMW